MTQRKRSRNAWTKWRRLISEQMRKGKSVAAFCREQKLCAPHFYWWKKRLRENTTARFVEVQGFGIGVAIRRAYHLLSIRMSRREKCLEFRPDQIGLSGM